MYNKVASALDQVQKAHARMNAGNRARQKLYHRPSRQRLGEALSFRVCLQRFHCTHGKPALLQHHTSSGEDLVVLTSPSVAVFAGACGWSRVRVEVLCLEKSRKKFVRDGTLTTPTPVALH